ncbi:MAG TPA: hypothetical protein VGP47_11810, partial [Parachlamydiaceae bacterium]|nr:hypothetical protein [Parachlamydiaceae bacterium]
VMAYNILLQKYVKNEDLIACEEILNKMLQTGINLTEFSYVVLMENYGKNRNLKGGLALLLEMYNSGLNPKDATYKMLLKFYLKNSGFEGGKSFLSAVKEIKILPEEVTNGMLMNLHVINGDLKGARELLEKIHEHGIIPHRGIYKSFINLLVELDYVEEAKALFLSHLKIAKHISKFGLNVVGLSYGAAFIALTIFLDSYWNGAPFTICVRNNNSDHNLFMGEYLQKKISHQFKDLDCQINQGVLKIFPRKIQILKNIVQIPAL